MRQVYPDFYPTVPYRFNEELRLRRELIVVFAGP
jgi:hypothetical protein